MLAEMFNYDFSTLGDQEEVPVTKIETDAFTLEFDKGTSETQPIYYKHYSRKVFFQPGNTMKVIAKGGAQIAKIILRYNVTNKSFVPDNGTFLNSGYGNVCTWEIPVGYSTVLFTAYETPQSQDISLSDINVVYYEQPVIPYCNYSEIKTGASVKIFSPGAEKLRIIKPDGSFEDLTCSEEYPINYAWYKIDFPLQAERTSIDVYPIQRNWHYTNLKTTFTFKQIFDEHTSTDIKVGNLYYRVTTDSEGMPYAEVQKDGRYRDLTEVAIPDYIRSSDGTNIKVGSIAHSAFSGCKYLRKIVLPSTLIEINNSAFWGCSSLESIDIPESVTFIGNGAFAYCRSLKTIVFPNNLKNFGNGSEPVSPIKGCESLIEVVLPNNASGTGIYWQYNTSSFLKGCNSIKEFIIPDNVNGLSDDFFTGNESVKTIKFGANFSDFPSSIIDLPNLTELIIDPTNNNYMEVEGALYCNYRQESWLLAWLRKLPEDGILRLIDNSRGIHDGALKGYTLQEVVYPATITSMGWSEQLSDCRVERLVIPSSMELLGCRAFRYSNIGTLVIEEGESPIIMDAYDSKYENDGVFHNSKIDNLVINRDIDNINNYGWPKSHTKAFYRCRIGTVTINTSLGEKACGILSDATVSTIKLGPDVKSIYALGNYECSNLEIYSINDIDAPFNTNEGPLNKVEGRTFNGFIANNIYVYPTKLDQYKSIYPYKTVLPLFGTSSIQFNDLTKTLRPLDTYSINYITLPGDLNLEWTSSNAKVAAVSEEGVVSAHTDGATIITAKCIDKGYEHLSQSMTVYVSENAELESDEAYLTIRGLGNHATRHCYKKGSAAVIDIIPDEGWSIHTITLNGEDISAAIVNNTILTPELYGENEMNIVFKAETVTGEAQIINSKVKLIYDQNEITVKGVAHDTIILIYDLSGRCVYKGYNHTISLETDKYYILKVDDALFKFIL